MRTFRFLLVFLFTIPACNQQEGPKNSSAKQEAQTAATQTGVPISEKEALEIFPLSEEEARSIIDGCECLFRDKDQIIASYDMQSKALIKTKEGLIQLTRERSNRNFKSPGEIEDFHSGNMKLTIQYGDQKRIGEEVWQDQNTILRLSTPERQVEKAVKATCGC